MCYNILHAAQIYYHAIQIFGLSRRLSEAAQLHQMQVRYAGDFGKWFSNQPN